MLVSGKSFVLMLGSLLLAATLAVLYVPTIGQAEQSATEATESTEKSDNVTKPDKNTAISTVDRDEHVELHKEPTPQQPHATERRNTESSEATVVTYSIPLDMMRIVSDWAKLNKFKYQLDDKTSRLVLQAPTEMHARFREQLEATSKWRTAYAAIEREQKPVVMFKKDGQPRLTWREMGLTFGPTKNLESRHVRPIVGVEVVGVEPGSPGAWLTIQPKDIVTNVSDFKSTNLSELESIIKAVLDGSPRVMHTVTVFKPNAEFFQTYLPPRFAVSIAGIAQWPAASVSNVEPPSAKHGPFPSLEDQKLADLAWKRFGLELEPIADDDLKRVKALGYDGGVKVVSDSAGVQGLNERIQPSDILVGLHVWPTTSLTDVANVLNRDDLAELSPLKFYVVRRVVTDVRQPGESGRPGSIAQEENDTIVTGRISVRVDGQPGFGQAERRASTPAANGNPYSAPVKRPAPAVSDADVPRYVLPSPADEAAGPKSPPVIPGIEAQADLNKRRATRQAVPLPGATGNKDSLRYDGKTFDEWRDLWKNELSTEKRAEAVKALAAFGRAGYGEEAVEAILDVAGNYDFSILSEDPEGKLKKVVLDELVPDYPRSHALAKYWLPDLADRLEKDPQKWKWLANNLLYRLQTDDPENIAALQSLARSAPAEVRPAALTALIRASISPDGRLATDEKTRKLLADALSGEDPAMTIAAIRTLLPYPPVTDGGTPRPILKLVSLLFHADEETRREARSVLRYIDKKESPQVVRQLLAVLEDESRKADHIHAIRGLTAMGAQSREAIPSLKRVLTQSDDRKLLLASLVAVERITTGYILPVPSVKTIGEAMKQAMSDEEISAVKKKLGQTESEEFIQAAWEEFNAAYSPAGQQLGGGGGFF